MSKNLSAKYYRENKGRSQKKLAKDIKSSQRRERKKQQYGHEHYKNLAEDKKQKLVVYRKKYCRMRKNAIL